MRRAALYPLAARALGGLGLAFFLAVLAGCSAGVGHVSGVVTYRGQPLPGGLIMFRPADGSQNAVSVGIDGQGRYSAELPPGEVMVLIDNRGLATGLEGGGDDSLPSGVPPGIPLSPEARAKVPPAPRGAARPKPADAPAAAGKYVPIPEKYFMVETSGLKITVKGGDQTENFELTD